MSSAVKVDLVFLAAGLYTARAPFLAQLTSTQHWINSMINSVYLTQSSIPPVGYRTLDVSTAAAAPTTLLQESRKNILRKPSYSQFCPKFRCHGNEGRSGKIRSAAFDSPSPKTPLQTQKSCRYLLHKPSYSEFCPKIRYHGNRGRQERNLNDNIR